MKSGREAIRYALVLTLLYSLPVVLAVRPVIDPDIWSHLRYGQWIVEHRAVPYLDGFSGPGFGKRWIAYSWLFEVGAYGLYRWLGLMGLVSYTAIMALLITRALHLFVRYLRPHPIVACVLTAIGVLAMGPLLVHPRPWLATILLFIVEIGLLLMIRNGEHRWPMLVLPLMFVLWANVHIQFVYGLFVLAIATVEPLIEAHWEDGLARGAARCRQMLGVFLACTMATMANPYGPGVYLAVYDAMTAIHPSIYLEEFQAMQFKGMFDWLVLALTLAAVFALGRARRQRLFPAVLLISGVALSFRTARDAWFVVVGAAMILADFWSRNAPVAGRLSTSWRVGVIAVLGIVTVGVGTQRVAGARLEAAVGEIFPAKAASAVEAMDYSGQIYNPYDWGGYLMWRLPRLRVSMDGRAPLYGDARILRSASTWAGRSGWQGDPDLLGAGVVIGPKGSALVSLLAGDTRFELVHEDDVAAVFVPRGGGRGSGRRGPGRV